MCFIKYHVVFFKKFLVMEILDIDHSSLRHALCTYSEYSMRQALLECVWQYALYMQFIQQVNANKLLGTYTANAQCVDNYDSAILFRIRCFSLLVVGEYVDNGIVTEHASPEQCKQARKVAFMD